MAFLKHLAIKIWFYFKFRVGMIHPDIEFEALLIVAKRKSI